MATGPRPFAEAVEPAVRLARLPLSAERRQIVGPTVEMIYMLIDTLDTVPLGEAPPATGFDPRRR